MVDFDAFAVRAGQECKSLRTLINGNAANLNSLTTSNKASLVAAINEIKAATAAAVGIDDATTSTTTTWSSAKISTFTGGGGGGSSIDDSGVSTGTVWSSSKTSSSINAVIGTAPTGLNTLGKVATALGNDAAYAATTTTALGNRVRVDSAQSFNSTQQTQARSNIGAVWTNDMGDPAADFVALFVAAML
jgi:hypothetical protein